MSSVESSPGRRLFVAAIVMAVMGGAAFFVGLSAAFGRAGNWSNHLAEFGILLLVAGGVANLAAVVLGLRSMLASRAFFVWWGLSAALAAVSIAGGLAAWKL